MPAFAGMTGEKEDFGSLVLLPPASATVRK
jgi:hypothetical protein